MIGSLSAVLVDLVTVLVFGFYFAGDGPDVVRTVAGWMPARGQRVFVTFSKHAGCCAPADFTRYSGRFVQLVEDAAAEG